VSAVIAPLGLKLAAAKTHVVHIDEGFDFLGHRIQRRRKRGTSKQYVYTFPSKKATASIRAKVKALTSNRSPHRDLASLLRRLTSTLRGWATYFRSGVAARIFARIDHHAFWCVISWIRRRHRRMGWNEMRRRFMDGWKLTADGVVFEGASTVKIKRYSYRGTAIPTPWPAIEQSA
jgi:RNA-directed DNA polymerase